MDGPMIEYNQDALFFLPDPARTPLPIIQSLFYFAIMGRIRLIKETRFRLSPATAMPIFGPTPENTI